MATVFVLPHSCRRLFFHDDATQNTTVWLSDLKQGVTNRTYYYSPEGYGVAYVSMTVRDTTAYTPDNALQVLSESLKQACDKPHSVPSLSEGTIPSIDNKEAPVSSIIMDLGSNGFLSLLDRKEGYLNSNSFTAYPGCVYKTNDPKIRMNGTSITPSNLTEESPVAFKTNMRGLVDSYFSDGYTAKYSIVLASDAESTSPKITLEMAASNLTASMDLQKEALLCFQKLYSLYMGKNDTISNECKSNNNNVTRASWITSWPCYTGNQKSDTQGQYCYCEFDVRP
ncbi:hypothetical protein HDU78_006380 [Chytriomyces hyalinus]|nr:hypothetical protein HDU78_006380 [Chytriomyces hyalinus]